MPVASLIIGSFRFSYALENLKFTAEFGMQRVFQLGVRSRP